MEELRNSESRSKHYLSVTLKLNHKENDKRPPRLDEWKTIKKDVKKNKEK